MKLNLKANQYLNDRSDDLIQQIHKYKRIALWASMGIGKTEFFKRALREYAKQNDSILVMINPSVGQIEQMGESDSTIATICQGKSYYGEKVVVSTPESLYKVMGDLLEKQQKFILVFDEAHEKVASINFRSKFGVVEKYEKYAEKVIYMTATPEPLLNESFDLVIDVEKEDENIIPCRVMKAERLNTSTKLKLIKLALSRRERVIFVNDNKVENQKLAEKLGEYAGHDTILAMEINEPVQESLFDEETPTVKEKSFELVSSDNRNGNAYKSIMKGEYPQDLKVLITTSFIKAGLNINNLPNTRMIITSSEESFLLVNSVQQMGRLRNRENIKGIDLIIPRVEIPRVYLNSFSPLERLAERMTNEAENHYNTYILDTRYIPSNEALDVACAVHDKELDKYVIDYNKLMYKIYSNYCRSLLIYPNRLKIELERQRAIRLNVEFIDLEAEENGMIEEEVKTSKKDRKEVYEEARKQLLALDPQNQQNVIMIPYDEIKLLREDLRQIAEAYHLHMSDTERKFINQVRRELCDGDKLQAHLKVLQEPKADIKREFDQLNALKLNREYDMVADKPRIIDKTIRTYGKKLGARVFFIRRELRELEPQTVKGKTKRHRLKRDIVNQIVTQMIDAGFYGKKINLTKATDKLMQDLQLIYNIYDNKIYSVKR